MFEELAEEAKEMSKRAKETTKVRFYLSFDDERIEQWAKAIEYGNERRPPVPFMRVTEEEHEQEWKDAQKGGLSAYVMDGEEGLTLLETCDEIAAQMEEDYKATAKEMKVPKRVIEGLKVEYTV